MEGLSKDLISLLQYLLPGFIAAWIFYGLTPYPKPSQFERVIQALIFTLLTRPVVFVAKYLLIWVGELTVVIAPWNDQADLCWAIIASLLLGVTLAYLANNDNFHAWARKLGITRQASHPSEWIAAFHDNVTFVVLHLEDGRRLYGWPRLWPTNSTDGHFYLEQASWLREDNAQVPTSGSSGILVAVADVKRVEFIEKDWSDGHVKEFQSTAPGGPADTAVPHNPAT
jgi:hypothetical protein